MAACTEYGPDALRGQRRAHQRRAFVDERAIPARAILLVEQDELAVGRGARLAARLVQQHQRQQPLHLGFGR